LARDIAKLRGEIGEAKFEAGRLVRQTEWRQLGSIRTPGLVCAHAEQRGGQQGQQDREKNNCI
jgi:hypothetical protein